MREADWLKLSHEVFRGVKLISRSWIRGLLGIMDMDWYAGAFRGVKLVGISWMSFVKSWV